ncbi:MAG: hypothetical protein GY847_29700 [Proteobacteria bacterium]|nr:hypothetical protein [Pseudomonadota bacterium]
MEADKAHAVDFRHFRGLSDLLGKPLLLGLVLSEDKIAQKIDDKNPHLWKVPAAGLLA